MVYIGSSLLHGIGMCGVVIRWSVEVRNGVRVRADRTGGSRERIKSKHIIELCVKVCSRCECFLGLSLVASHHVICHAFFSSISIAFLDSTLVIFMTKFGCALAIKRA